MTDRETRQIGLFCLNRGEDKTGVSGPGIVAYGTVYPNGWVSVAWCVSGKPQNINIYSSLQDMFDIHVGPHGGRTQLEWLLLSSEGQLNSPKEIEAVCRIAKKALQGAVMTHSRECQIFLKRECDCWLADRKEALARFAAIGEEA